MPNASRIMIVALVIANLAGCALHSRLFPPAPFSERAPCTLSPSASKDQIIAHLNENITGTAGGSGIVAWRSTNVSIHIPGLPRLPATLAVEAPRNLRLLVSNPLSGGEEVDMGSNDEHFWLWLKEMDPPQVITARHEELPLAGRYLPIPFQPDWLIEVLGVIPLDPTEYQMEPATPDGRIVELVANRLSPTGQNVRRVVRVDRCHGIVLEHRLESADRQLIARATLAKHQRDPETGHVMPSLYHVRWPQAQAQLRISVGKVDVNPRTTAAVWEVPQKPGCPQVDLGQWAQQARPVHMTAPQGRPAVPPPLEQPGRAVLWKPTADSVGDADPFSPPTVPPATARP
ncbi:hypothetical protein [Maioricimonas rarisocia]|nr:hypothetical protein [Maioricimonas rarisocia]